MKQRGTTDIRTCADGYVWRILPIEKAIDYYKANIGEVYRLYDDGSEGLIESEKDFYQEDGTIDTRAPYGIGIGFIKDMMPTCPFCGEPVNLSEIDGYLWSCPACEADFYSIEMEPYYYN